MVKFHTDKTKRCVNISILLRIRSAIMKRYLEYSLLYSSRNTDKQHTAKYNYLKSDFLSLTSKILVIKFCLATVLDNISRLVNKKIRQSIDVRKYPRYFNRLSGYPLRAIRHTVANRRLETWRNTKKSNRRSLCETILLNEQFTYCSLVLRGW